jgi:hypothetical protein
MKSILIALAFACAGEPVLAQDATVKELKDAAGTTIARDTSLKIDKHGWVKGGLFSVNMTQISNSNWIAAGGDKFSLSFASSLNAFANKLWGRNTWDNRLDINYALVNTTTLGVRKANDRIDLVSKYGHMPKRWKTVSISSLAQFRSQLTNGYEYDYFGSSAKRRNSGWFAPAYITLAPLGLDWHPSAYFSVFGSPAVGRWVIVSNNPNSFVSPNGVFNGQLETPLSTLYGVDSGSRSRGEFGAFITASFKKDIMKNVNYYSKVDLYSNYLNKPANIDVFWTNQFRLKVNQWIQVSYTLDMLYDDDVQNPLFPTRPLGLQVLSTLGVGFAAKF